MTDIHPSAVIDPRAQVGEQVKIGPFCYVQGESRIGDRCRLEAHVVIRDGVTMGTDNEIHENSIIGGRPQHLNASPDVGGVRIGSGNTIREHATIHRALERGSNTEIGDHNLLMVNAHVAHDCRIGNRVVLVNNVMLAGHVTVQDRAYISGGVGIHQFCRVGRYAMIAGVGRITRDVPPFVMVDGSRRGVAGLNIVGLRRSGFTREQIAQLKDAYRLIYRSDLGWDEILIELSRRFSVGPASDFHSFFVKGQRGYVPKVASGGHQTLEVVRDDEAKDVRSVRKAA